jgi:cephalosporin hydroxylase
MRIVIDTAAKTLSTENEGEKQTLQLYSREAFEILSHEWLKIGWNEKYAYSFTWLGRPIIQLPEDMIRLQEVIYRVKPDVIIETGIAHGGSLVFSASLCQLMGRGRVIGVDIEIRAHNRAAVEAHELASRITMIEGSSTDPTVVERVRSQIRPGESVLVILDSCHTKAHVLAELEAYSGLVSVGSYIIATDGIMRDLADVPRGEKGWAQDHPTAAAREFSQRHPQFVLGDPPWAFRETELRQPITYWPGAWLRRERA